MTRILVGMLAVLVLWDAAVGQSPSQTDDAGDKHYGTVCVRLTGDSECRVCAMDRTDHWKCYSHSVWKEIPGTALPLPDKAPAPKHGTAPGDSEVSANLNCDTNWSSKFDQITEPKVSEAVHADLDEAVSEAGGLDAFLAGWQQAEESDRSQLAQHERAGDAKGVHVLNELMLVNEGMIEIAKCRLGQQSDISEIPSSEETEAASANSPSEDASSNTSQDPTQCALALQYVSPGGPLERNLQVASNRYNARLEGLHLMLEQKTDLANDSWWATSQGPVVAARIKVICDEIQDVVSIFNPAVAKLNTAQELFLDSLRIYSAKIKAAYEHRESVLAAIKAAEAAEREELTKISTEKGAETLAETLKLSPAYGAYKSLKDEKEYFKTLEKAAESREIVQEQVRNLDEEIIKVERKISVDAEEQTALKALRQDVIQACSQKPIAIPPR